VGSPTRRKHESLTVLNRFQKRLVHQLVESEFPFLITIGRPTFVQIKYYDEERERLTNEEKARRTEERVLRQTGFRWVIEALIGGNLELLDNRVFANILTDPDRNPEKMKLDDFAESLKSKLKGNRPVLVGHNLFMDIIYLYQCFLGSLPDDVDEFTKLMKDHFPVLIDTKYMATHECGSINPTSSLTEIHEKLKKRKKPKISKLKCHYCYLVPKANVNLDQLSILPTTSTTKSLSYTKQVMTAC
jgi:poly(A)-specific ribonuclease